MKVLYIGGTGEISFSCVLESIALGHEVSVFNRGQTEQSLSASAHQIAGDLADDAGATRLGEQQLAKPIEHPALDANVQRVLRERAQKPAGRVGTG